MDVSNEAMKGYNDQTSISLLKFAMQTSDTKKITFVWRAEMKISLQVLLNDITAVR